MVGCQLRGTDNAAIVSNIGWVATCSSSVGGEDDFGEEFLRMEGFLHFESRKFYNNHGA